MNMEVCGIYDNVKLNVRKDVWIDVVVRSGSTLYIYDLARSSPFVMSVAPENGV